ncbi:DUF2934 domain-containing protein [Caballeronia hypogeia]|uniref:DUF2934 domain-containing protein n=1 Tax=Caballeronia hypogeia TaxID=1777140 RepID=UPI0007726578|nr:DUF2934 domain-containing protein [Caballeronia hypogeia]
MQSTLTDESIRERAYYLWEADGRPEGRDQHYWHLASSQLLMETVVPAPQLAAANRPASKPKTAARRVATDGKRREADKADKKSPVAKPKKVTAASKGLGATKVAEAKSGAPGKKAADGLASGDRVEL